MDNLRIVVREFMQALHRSHTYDLRNNSYTWFGLAWGTGAPLMWVVFMVVTEGAFDLGHVWAWMTQGTGVLITLPPIFAVLFGVLGTIRWEKERLVLRTFEVLDGEVEQRTRDLLDTYLQTVLALSEAIEAKDPYTRGHCQRVWTYAERAGRRLGLSPHDLEDLRFACYLHDVGKIHIPGRLLNKKGPLNPEERAIIRSHPARGARIVAPIRRFDRVASIILQHHEREDGSGYPKGLASDEIPLLTKILATADALDAMTSDRSYRPGIGMVAAIEELRRCAGLPFDSEHCADTAGRHHFDPAVVKVFVEGLLHEHLGDETLAAKINPPEPVASIPPRRLNCWEVRNCKLYEADPPCPAATAQRFDGLNSGQNGGRICWAVVGAFCVTADEPRSCNTCSFFEQVRLEQGLANFILIPEATRSRIRSG